MLAARDAAAAVAAGFRQAGVDADECPVADGGEGTADALRSVLGGIWREATVADPLGRPVAARWLELPDGTAVVEAAAAVGLGLVAPEERDPLRASSRGLGELIVATEGRPLLVCLGGSATVDGGRGLREVVSSLPAGTRVACDVASPLLDAARLFARQKGADDAAVSELERRLAADAELAPYADLPGAGAAGGLGAALASLGAELVPGARLVLDAVGFDRRATRSSSPARAASTRRRARGSPRPRSRAGAVPPGFAASCSAGSWPSRSRESRRSRSRATPRAPPPTSKS